MIIWLGLLAKSEGFGCLRFRPVFPDPVRADEATARGAGAGRGVRADNRW